MGAALARLPLDLIRAGLLLAAFGSAALSLMALGGRISPLLDIASHFALPGLLASVLAWVLALLVTRKGERSALWLAVVGTLCWGLLLAPDYAARLTAKRAPAGEQTIKIVQFNLWAVNSDRAGSSAWILAQDPDVVVLEEVSGISDKIVRRLAERYPYAHSCADPSPCSTMILSKAQPLASGGQIFPGGPSNLTWVSLQGPGGPYSLIGVHQSWPYPIADQPAQTAAVADTLKRFDPAGVIVAGDFNSTPWSAALKKQDRLFGLNRLTHALPTFPARVFGRRSFAFPAPLLPLDHVYAGRDWKVVSLKRGPRLGSDHYPLVTVLRWDAAQTH